MYGRWWCHRLHLLRGHGWQLLLNLCHLLQWRRQCRRSRLDQMHLRLLHRRRRRLHLLLQRLLLLHGQLLEGWLHDLLWHRWRWRRYWLHGLLHGRWLHLLHGRWLHLLHWLHGGQWRRRLLLLLLR